MVKTNQTTQEEIVIRKMISMLFGGVVGTVAALAIIGLLPGEQDILSAIIGGGCALIGTTIALFLSTIEVSDRTKLRMASLATAIALIFFCFLITSSTWILTPATLILSILSVIIPFGVTWRILSTIERNDQQERDTPATR